MSWIQSITTFNNCKSWLKHLVDLTPWRAILGILLLWGAKLAPSLDLLSSSPSHPVTFLPLTHHLPIPYLSFTRPYASLTCLASLGLIRDRDRHYIWFQTTTHPPLSVPYPSLSPSSPSFTKTLPLPYFYTMELDLIEIHLVNHLCQ